MRNPWRKSARDDTRGRTGYTVCGICGVVTGERFAPPEPIDLDAMAATLAHRGPDSAGSVVSGQAGLAMRRLAIIDVQGGQQPLTSEDGTVHVICNGEI